MKNVLPDWLAEAGGVEQGEKGAGVLYPCGIFDASKSQTFH